MEPRSPYTLLVDVNRSGIGNRSARSSSSRVISAKRVDLEVFPRIHKAGRHGRLAGEVIHRGDVSQAPAEGTGIPDVAQLELEERSVCVLQPLKVAIDARSGQVVIHQHASARGEQPGCQIRADEAGAPKSGQDHSYHQASGGEFASGFGHTVGRDLSLEPGCQISESFLQAYVWLKPRTSRAWLCRRSSDGYRRPGIGR